MRCCDSIRRPRTTPFTSVIFTLWTVIMFTRWRLLVSTNAENQMMISCMILAIMKWRNWEMMIICICRAYTFVLKLDATIADLTGQLNHVWSVSSLNSYLSCFLRSGWIFLCCRRIPDGMGSFLIWKCLKETKVLGITQPQNTNHDR